MPARGLFSQSGFGGQSREFHAAEISEYAVILIHLNPWRGVEGLHVAARYENVLPTVVVEIGDGGRVAGHGHAEAGHAARLRHVGEIALAGIAENGKRLVVERYEGNVGITVVVDVAKIDAHSGNEVAFVAERDVRFEGNLFELTAAFVVEQGIVEFVVGDEDVHPTVEIVIGDADPHSFSGVGADSVFAPRHRGRFRRRC